jgi:hypothetical protein
MFKYASCICLFLCLHAANAAPAGKMPAADPYAGLKVVTAPGEKKKAMILVLPDGRIAGWKDLGAAEPDGEHPPLGAPMGRISGNAILDTSGTVRMKFEADGRIIVSDMKGKPRFNAADEMLDDDGVRTVWLAPDGTAMLNMNGTPGPLPFQVQGVTAGNRRMAVLLVLFAMAPRPVPTAPPRQAPSPSGAEPRPRNPAAPKDAPAGAAK